MMERCPPCNDTGALHCAHPEECGQMVNFGPCKKCGAPLIMASVPEGRYRRLIAVCTVCDIVREKVNG